MIGKLSGIVDSISQGHLILDVNGVGYVVHASGKTLTSIPSAGEPLSLLIETQVREDAITLFGFKTLAEQDWFKLLTSVQGVGAKAGLSILSIASPQELSLIIASQDKAGITRADGVGPKLATRILTELKDKAGKIDSSSSLPPSIPPASGGGGSAGDGGEEFTSDALSALINLGYGRSEAYSAVMNAQNAGNDNLQSIITAALKELSA